MNRFYNRKGVLNIFLFFESYLGIRGGSLFFFVISYILVVEFEKYCCKVVSFWNI